MTARRLARAGLDLAQRLCIAVHAASSRPAGGGATRGGGDPGAGPALPGPGERAQMLARTEAWLATDILPFWTRRTWDETGGGFITHLDRRGERRGVTDKYLVMQARMIWTLAAAHRHGLTGAGYLELAACGVRFLLERMWDARPGGFPWAVARDGRAVDDRKMVYGHAFAIYGLAEYGLAAGDAGAVAAAERVFDLLEARASDGDLGFREQFGPDWTPLPGEAGERKTLNTHMHLLEGLTTLLEATGKARHRDALDRLGALILARTIHPTHRCVMDPFDRHWRPRLPGGRLVTSYGHGVELAWLLVAAADALGQGRERVLGPALDLVDHALAYGFDGARGGLARFGPARGRSRWAVYLSPGRAVRSWWEQAELLVATVEAHAWTGAGRYLTAFARQLDWVWRHQADHEGGSWFEHVAPDGRPLILDKGHDWKDPYHEARALMRVGRALRSLGAGPPGSGRPAA